MARTYLEAVRDDHAGTFMLPLDETSGAPQDAIGSNNGTLEGSPTQGVDGLITRAIDFDGAGDYVEVPADAAFEPGTADFSVSFIFDPDQVSNTVQLLNKKQGGLNEVGYNVTQIDNHLGIGLSDGNDTAFDATGVTGEILTAGGGPYHVAIAFDRDDVATIYVDGVAEGTLDISIAQGSLNNASMPLRFGARTPVNGGGVEQFFDGQASHAAYHDKLLSAQDARDLSMVARGRLGKTHPAIIQLRNLIDAHPAATTLDSTVLIADAQITVVDGSAFEVGHQLRVDNEWMLVTGVSGTTIDVDRGIAGTTAADHLSGTPIDIIGHPGFILAPGVPGAAAVGDLVVADQADDPIAHGEGLLGASIEAATPLGSFVSGLSLATDGSNDHFAIGEVVAFGSEVEGGWAVFAFMLDAATDGTIWGGEDVNGVGVSLDLDANTLQWSKSNNSSWYARLTSDETIDPTRGVVAVLNWSDAAGSFIVAGGKTIGVSLDTSGTPQPLEELVASRLGENETAMGLSEGALDMTATFVAAAALPSAITESEAKAAWAMMQAGGGLFPLPSMGAGL